MAEKKTTQTRGQGTFAQLYDVQEQLSRRNSKPLGRPPKKVQRKPTTVHLTKSEARNLSKLHLQFSEHFSVNRSELVGIAIDALALLVESQERSLSQNGPPEDLEAFRQTVFDFLKS